MPGSVHFNNPAVIELLKKAVLKEELLKKELSKEELSKEEKESWDQFYQYLERPLRGYIYKWLLKNNFLKAFENHTEDILSDIKTRVRYSIKNFKLESEIDTWVAAIARHTLCDYVKKSRILRLRSISLEGKDISLEEALISLELNPEQHCFNNEIWKMVNKLPKRDRYILEKIYKEGFTCTEVSGLLGISVTATRAALSRAIAKLRNFLL